MTNEPDSTGADRSTSSQNSTPESSTEPSTERIAGQTPTQSRTYAPRPSLGRGFGAYEQPQASYGQPPAAYPTSEFGQPPAPVSRKDYASVSPVPFPPAGEADASSSHSRSSRSHPLAWLMPWRPKQSQPAPSPLHSPQSYHHLHPSPSQSGERLAEGPQLWPGVSSPEDVYGEEQAPVSPDFKAAPRLWERQPYAVVAHLLLVSGAITAAWVFGILVAQVLPGRFNEPPLQESLLRKSSRVTRRLWNFSQLWHSPTTQVRVDAVPLPETGPVLKPVVLSPIERQPLVDELNAIDTEIVTLDRRLRSLEKQLGGSPYQGTGIENRIETMRAAIDPPVRSESAADAYAPTAANPNDRLLEVAQLQITLPGDTLFAPGAPGLKTAALLEGVLDQLVNYPEATISVRVHSDNQANAIASREYTLAQANTLARYLQRNLPTTHRWIPVGMGAAQPIADNTDAISRQQNRRIEILVDTR